MISYPLGLQMSQQNYPDLDTDSLKIADAGKDEFGKDRGGVTIRNIIISRDVNGPYLGVCRA